jgi:hypothetical protein
MGYTQAIEMANLMDMEQCIRWHLNYNHYPPIPIEMIPIAVKAIRLCREDKFDETIVTFFEHQGYGWSLPAYAIVKAYHLEPWVGLKLKKAGKQGEEVYDRTKEQGSAYSRGVRQALQGEGNTNNPNGETGQAKDLGNSSPGKTSEIRYKKSVEGF